MPLQQMLVLRRGLDLLIILSENHTLASMFNFVACLIHQEYTVHVSFKLGLYYPVSVSL